MNKWPWLGILAWVIATFFFVGAFANLFPADEATANYARWGYPGWFHYVTGFLELTAGLLLIPQRSRLIGGLLGAGVMFAAAGTVLLHSEYAHAIPPLVVLGLCLVVAVSARQSLRAMNMSWR